MGFCKSLPEGEIIMQKNSVQRFQEIVKVFAFYGFGYIVNSKIKKKNTSPENLRKAFEELGSTFIKIGQILSTRPDILPEAYANELAKLQDNAPAEDFKSISNIFFKEFKAPINDAFLYFDETPLACASIAQVHEAIMKDGSLVIVKIQRPHIADKMKLDLSILRKIIGLAKNSFNDFLIDPEEAIKEITFSTAQELNFKNEAENIIKFAALNKDVAFVYSPDIVTSLCSNRVLTMERISGFKIDDLKQLKKGGYDLMDLGKKLALSYFKQVLKDGFFHADPHPGNLLINDGKICYIDFGLMGNLSPSLKAALNDAILAIAFKDVDKLISVIMSIGVKKGRVDRNALYEAIDYLLATYLSTSLKNIKISVLLQEVFDTARHNNISLPKDLILLAKSMVLIEGVIAKISPDLAMIDVAVPYVKSNNKSALFDNMNFDEALLHSYHFVKDTAKLPSKLIELSDSIICGRAKIQLQHTNLEKSIVDVNKMVNRIVFAVIISSMILSSSFVLSSNIGPKIYNMSIVGVSGFLAAAIMGIWLLISIIRSGTL